MNLHQFRAMRKNSGVIALAAKGSTAELLIYDVIGEDIFGDGVSAAQIVRELGSLPAAVDSISVRINSPGGDVCDGLAIYQALVRHPAKVHVQIDSLAASMASVIAMAGDTITMAPTGLMMIHNAWGIVAGDANDLRSIADVMDKHSAAMAVAYGRSNIPVAQIRSIMDAETWYTADEAKAAGWVDEVLAQPAKLAARVSYDLSGFKHPPAAKTTAAADPDPDACTCPCQPCLDGDCSLCSDEGCSCEGCDCPESVGAKALNGAEKAAKTEQNDDISAETDAFLAILNEIELENLRLAEL